MSSLSVSHSHQFIRFILAGGIAAGVNFGSRFLFDIWLGYESAIILAYLAGMVTAFVLMRGHVFQATGGSLRSQVLKFTGVNLLAVLQTLIISLILADWILPEMGITEHVKAIAHFVGVIVPVITSYFGHRLLTFR